MPFPGIQTIVTFFQETEPSTPAIGDVWFNPTAISEHCKCCTKLSPTTWVPLIRVNI